MNEKKMLKNFLKDRDEVLRNSKSGNKNKNSFKEFQKIVEKLKEQKESDNVVVDFTEYNPLHKGHKYCLDIGKKHGGVFISVIPGPLERSGRGIPYLINRHIRAEMAIKAGADIVVEGPPMGIMGSGQCMQCLIKMFYSVGGDIIPRGYIEEETMKKVIDCINKGYHIKVKPYRISCIETQEVLGEKLEIDNYVIASMSYTIHKLREQLKNWNPKFIFIKRIEGISGTKIRESILNGDFDSIKHMLPESTLKILKKYYEEGISNIILNRFEDRIIETANEFELKEYLPENLAEKIEKNRPYNSLEELKDSIPYGFSKNYKERIISKLEARIEKEVISEYIKNYPSEIKVLMKKDD